MSVTAYSRSQIALHWAVALLILFQYVANDGIKPVWRAIEQGLPVEPSSAAFAHVAAGVLVLVLALARLGLRFKRGVPPLPAEEPALQRLAAHATHLGLYVLMVLIPISGMVAFFGAVHDAADAHEAMTSILLALIALHVLGALYHHFILKTDVLRRMAGRVRG